MSTLNTNTKSALILCQMTWFSSQTNSQIHLIKWFATCIRAKQIALPNQTKPNNFIHRRNTFEYIEREFPLPSLFALLKQERTRLFFAREMHMSQQYLSKREAWLCWCFVGTFYTMYQVHEVHSFWKIIGIAEAALKNIDWMSMLLFKSFTQIIDATTANAAAAAMLYQMRNNMKPISCDSFVAKSILMCVLSIFDARGVVVLSAPRHNCYNVHVRSFLQFSSIFHYIRIYKMKKKRWMTGTKILY